MQLPSAHPSPYVQSPVYETAHFRYRLVRPEDAAELLDCYSDPAAVPLFNSDNCHSDFHFRTEEEVSACIRCWLDAYSWQAYVRFSVIDKVLQKAVGTLEIFVRSDAPQSEDGAEIPTAVLRLDLASAYEREDLLEEIAGLAVAGLYEDFPADRMITKIVPADAPRIRAFMKRGFAEVPAGSLPFDHYYVHIRPGI
ncbi:GNAT family N-acetyltransferase [Paenibacillus spiritus]|uniref:GNAT family N-acetyltransferase n=1 Tax=Paenibacillus spiritus TaxID=2496557 RepID=A0A5J5G2A8_9BACL|nr:MULTISPECIES: GNAT family protein [Paenibacillus]KAA9000962.1 GNAT family N-acetyltransferase [Paenibacillus spiritus]